MLFRLIPLGVLLLLVSAVASAAPTYPFPAQRRRGADWYTEAATLPLERAGAPTMGRVALGWDADALYVHVAETAPQGTVALQCLNGERRITWANGAGRLTDAATKEISTPAPITIVKNGATTVDAAIRWTDLGVKAPKAGQALPLCVGWGENGGPVSWLPDNPLMLNPLTYGALYLNDGAHNHDCATTLTQPFRFHFNPTHGVPALTVEPEPVQDLCIPVEITYRAIGPTAADDHDLRTQITAGGPARFELPAAPGASVVAVTMRVPMYNGSVPDVEYRALPRGVVLDKYAGAKGWDVPADWDNFWARARADLARTPMNARITEVKERQSATGRLYRVELDSLGNITIVGWYFVPKDVDVLHGKSARKYPAVQIMPGYGAEEPPIDRTADGYITFSVNPRGHGPSGAFWPLPGDHLNYHIDDAEQYYYRGAYMDCVRAMQFVMGRPEVDTRNVGVEGSSQGGALALATAALDNRVAACSANVPFLCDFPSAVRLCTRGGLSGLRDRFESDTPEGAAVRKTLSYIDASFMATHIACPTLIAVGQMDRTCPPFGGAAAFNRIPDGVAKQLMVVPNRDHEVMPEWRTASESFFRHWLKEK